MYISHKVQSSNSLFKSKLLIEIYYSYILVGISTQEEFEDIKGVIRITGTTSEPHFSPVDTPLSTKLNFTNLVYIFPLSICLIHVHVIKGNKIVY